MTIRSIFRTLVAGTISLFLLTNYASAGRDYSQEEVRALLARDAILPLQQLRERHADVLVGRMLDVEVEEKHGKPIYEFEVLGEDGVVREIKVDAATGDLLEIEVED